MSRLLKAKSLFFKQMFLVGYKDFRYLVFSPLFFLFLGISFIFLSYSFPRELFNFVRTYTMSMYGQGLNSSGNIHFQVFVSHVSWINLILLFVVPILTMRLISEEKKNQTFVLFMTSPISSIQMVLGKYFAILMSLIVFLTCSLVYPLSVGFFTELPFGPLFSSYVGLFMLVSLYASVGLFASALTSSLFLSAFLGLILNISLWFISQGQGFTNSFMVSLMDFLSLSIHLTNFIKGSFVLLSFVFFLSLIVLFLFLTFKVIEMERWRS